MSSGKFSVSKYLSDKGGIHPIRIQPEGSPANGTPPAGAVDEDISAKVGGSRRTYGLHARGVRLVRSIGTGDDQANRYNFYPVLTPTHFATLNRGGTLTIDGVAWTISGKVNEVVR